ncbi:MAG: type II toxin-antitoxin system VapC family toxin [Chloroflexi bacterium]|nr:type II toxin-antitoxin system VapC family toxin [Chloroflexota bacterium]
MSGYLLDTNVISELPKTPPNTGVITFLSRQDDLWIPSIALHELQYGLQLLPHGRRRYGLEFAMTAFIAEYEERILPLYREAAEHAGSFRAQAHRSGRLLTVGDALIAGTAAAHGLILATRNTKDFDYLSIEIINPWQNAQPAI